MSTSAGTGATGPIGSPHRRGTTDLLVLAGFLGALGVGFWLLSEPEPRPLSRSAVGFDGLVGWLKSNDVNALRVVGGREVDPDSVGLRILPLYDSHLDAVRPVPQTEQDLIFQRDERDATRQVIRRKIKSLPTLLVLPKWRTGMRLSGQAHPELALPDPERDGGQRPIGWNGIGDVAFTGETFGRFTAQGRSPRLTAEIYFPQVLRGSDCRPVIARQDDLLLARCTEDGTSYWVLSDPDLLNAHGLRLGDNAAIALDMLPALARGGTIVVDYAPDAWAEAARRRADASSGGDAEDRSRLFAYPFSLIWVGIGILIALTLWRSVVRYGPVAGDPPAAPEASKEASLAARARLLRLSGQDGDLGRAHVEARLQYLADEVFAGRAARSADLLEAIQSVLKRRDAPLSAAFGATARALQDLPTAAPGNQVAGPLHDFESCYTQVMHEFGRASRPR